MVTCTVEVAAFEIKFKVYVLAANPFVPVQMVCVGGTLLGTLH